VPLRIYLAGRVRVEDEGVVVDERDFPGRQGRLAFAYLAVERSRAVPRDELADALWGDSRPGAWEDALSAIISKLRGLLGRAGLDGTRVLPSAYGCYQLQLPPGTWVDLEAALDGLHLAETALREGGRRDQLGWVELAFHITRRPFLPGEDRPWVEAVRARLHDMRVRSLECSSAVYGLGGDTTMAVARAEEAVRLEPFRESAHRALMRAHVSAGNRAEALRAYERCRTLLAEELGINPAAKTEELYVEILRSA
jgi:DNA-binding SARP family transcriptional activator